MKKYVLFAALCVGICRFDFVMAYEQCLCQKVLFSSLTPQTLQEVMEGDHEDWAIFFDANMRVPVQALMQGDWCRWVRSDAHVGTLEVVTPFYMRLVGGDLLLSSHGTEWYTLGEFFTGSLSAFVRLEEEIPEVCLHANINLRPHEEGKWSVAESNR